MKMNGLTIKRKSILVIGDVMLDIYFNGEVERISPEAPVPVFRKKSERYVPGGAANVAMNLSAANQKVTLMSVIGNDENGKRLREILEKEGISTELMINGDKITTAKTRFVANGNQQVMRSDVEITESISSDLERKLIEKLSPRIKEYDIVVISDYRKGLLSFSLIREIKRLCADVGIKILADIKDNENEKYNGVYLLKPNKKELSSLTGRELLSTEDIHEAARILLESVSCEYILTTLGAKGMLMVGKDGEYMIPSAAREVFDVTGAGDTAISYLAVCIANVMDIKDAVKIANIASGIQVGKSGTSQVSLNEIEEYLQNEPEMIRKKKEPDLKIFNRSDAGVLNKLLSGKKVVFTNGCFDILHIGHTKYLNDASKLGDVLIVGVNSDDSVKRLKGDNRPVNTLDDRMGVLAALNSVDYVIPFEDDTPYGLINDIQPDIIVKGGDYRPEEVVGKDIVEKKGGRVVIIPLLEGKSTSNVIDRINDTNRDKSLKQRFI